MSTAFSSRDVHALTAAGVAERQRAADERDPLQAAIGRVCAMTDDEFYAAAAKVGLDPWAGMRRCRSCGRMMPNHNIKCLAKGHP